MSEETIKEPDAPKPEQKAEEIPVDKYTLMPFSFGFDFHGDFIQGTFKHNPHTRQISADMSINNGEFVPSLEEFAKINQWSNEKGMECATKIHGILQKQLSGK